MKRTLIAQRNFASDPGASASLNVWEVFLVRSLGEDCPDGVRCALAQTAQSVLFLCSLCLLGRLERLVGRSGGYLRC